jgi:hypothetical protein
MERSAWRPAFGKAGTALVTACCWSLGIISQPPVSGSSVVWGGD